MIINTSLTRSVSFGAKARFFAAATALCAVLASVQPFEAEAQAKSTEGKRNGSFHIFVGNYATERGVITASDAKVNCDTAKKLDSFQLLGSSPSAKLFVMLDVGKDYSKLSCPFGAVRVRAELAADVKGAKKANATISLRGMLTQVRGTNTWAAKLEDKNGKTTVFLTGVKLAFDGRAAEPGRRLAGPGDGNGNGNKGQGCNHCCIPNAMQPCCNNQQCGEECPDGGFFNHILGKCVEMVLARPEWE